MTTTTKDRHYWTQLRSSLTAGQWLSSSPAKTPNGISLPWSELFRKFNKHCKGFGAVAEVAQQTQALAVLLCANSRDEDQDEPVRPDEYPLELGDECVLPPERIEEAKAGYNILKKLESSNFDTLNFALAYYAYALGNPAECLEHLSKVPDVSHVQNHIPLPATLRASTLLHVPTGGSSISSSSVSPADSLVGSESTISIAEIKDGRAWAMAETIRSLCLQGMSHEKLYPTEPLKALKTYSAAFPLLTIVETELASSASLSSPSFTSSGKIDFSSFTRFREVWRWVERLLWRAIVLGSRIFDVNRDHRSSTNSDSIWTWLDHYSSCSVYWPSSFRTSHRSTVSVLYLRALVLRYGYGSGSTSSPRIANTKKAPPKWIHTARSIIQEYRAILTVSTKFPKAGERNYKVEDFAELSVAIWETIVGVSGGGEYGGWVLDVLWWSTRLTFNSPPIQRHLTRLLYVSGDVGLARRTLRLYVQIVRKAWETRSASVHASGGAQFETETEADTAQIDTDRAWVQTCVFGARMICKVISSPSGTDDNMAKKVNDDLKEAGRLIELARERLKLRIKLDVNEYGKVDEDIKEDKELARSVDLAEGIWLSVSAVKHHNPDTRSKKLAKAHALFLSSVGTASGEQKMNENPEAHYHLALSYARYGYSSSEVGVGLVTANAIGAQTNGVMDTHVTQDLQKAILHSATAAQLNPSEIRYWHLLGLLSAKIEQWEAALGALEAGEGVGEMNETNLNLSANGTNDNGDPYVVKGENDDGGVHGRDGSGDTLNVPSVNGHGGSIAGESGVEIDGLPHSDPQQHRNAVFQTTAWVEGERMPVYVLPTKALTLTQSQTRDSLPPSSTLLFPFTSSTPFTTWVPPSKHDLFEYALQLRMTQISVAEYVEGPEGAAEKLREVFEWIAERREGAGAGMRGSGGGDQGHGTNRASLELTRTVSGSGSMTMKLKTPSELALSIPNSNSNSPLPSQLGHENQNQIEIGKEIKVFHDAAELGSEQLANRPSLSNTKTGSTEPALRPPVAIPITISPATPDGTGTGMNEGGGSVFDVEKEREKKDPFDQIVIGGNVNGTGNVTEYGSVKRLQVQVQPHERDTSKSKKMQHILKSQVQKGSTRISTISKKIGHGVVRNGSLRRSNSTPDFHAVLRPTSYQASSIHSRRRISAAMNPESDPSSLEGGDVSSPPPPPPPALPPTSTNYRWSSRTMRENRLLSNLWLMSAATFRRLGKIEQAKGAIQEAEVRDEANPDVWMQLGLYYVALGRPLAATEAFQKALFISPDNVAASIHLARMLLFPEEVTPHSSSMQFSSKKFQDVSTAPDNVDLAAGLLEHLTQGAAWDVAEAWYFLAKAYGMQGRRERERECLTLALKLSENRGVRDFGVALGLCL